MDCIKKLLLYLFVFIIICFILPALLTKRKAIVVTDEENFCGNICKEENNDKFDNKEGYQYKKYGEISLLHTKTGEIENIAIDDYLCNVVSAEMPVDFNEEALKAQAIVARTYTVYKILNKKHENADICDDSNCCQAWISKENRLARWDEVKRDENWKKICNCVYSTKGKIITYDKQPINAFFHSNSGGITETPVNVWGGSGYPYLQSVETSGEENYSQYLSELEISFDELIKKLKIKYSDIQINTSKEDEIKILEYTQNNRVKTIRIGNHDLSGVEVRQLLGLRSTLFDVSVNNQKVKFTVHGYGHGVGMSQTGADSMAKNGASAEEIIKHFYNGVEVVDMNSI